MRPQKTTEFKPISELENYTSREGYFCTAVVFSPETENSHFEGCPPYIALCNGDHTEDVYFKVPDSVAYYAKMHSGYTMKGLDNARKSGRRDLAADIKRLLEVE